MEVEKVTNLHGSDTEFESIYWGGCLQIIFTISVQPYQK